MMNSGAMYGASSAILTTYGAGSEKFTASLCSGLYEHLKNQGMDFNGGDVVSPARLYSERNAAERGYDFFKKNSIASGNLIGSLGNVNMILSAAKVAKTDGAIAAAGRGVHGVVNALGASIAAFVPETTDEQRAHKEKMAQKEALEGNKKNADKSRLTASISDGASFIGEKISDSPLAIQGGFMLIDNAGDAYDTFQVRERYKRREKLGDSIKDRPDPTNSKRTPEYRAYKKEWNNAGHNARLQENARAISRVLEGVENSATLKNSINVAENIKPSLSKCSEIIQTMEKYVGKSSALDRLIKERKKILHELSEVEKHPRGWMVAGTKSLAWTASSVANVIATKNNKFSTDAKYDEIFANVATMALEVDTDLRECKDAPVYSVTGYGGI